MSEPTGVAAVDAALDRLSTAAELPPAEQVAVYEDMHRMLTDALADLDEGAQG
jgi:hypothetical protein